MRKIHIKNIIFFFLPALSLIVAFHFLYPNFFARGAHGLYGIFFSTSSGSETVGFFVGSQEEESLKRELEEARRNLVSWDLLLSENRELKALLGRGEEENRVLATVIGRPNASPYDTVIIDVGKKHGVSLDDLIVAQAVAIGKVREVFDKTSLVSLFSSPNEEVNLIVNPRSSTEENDENERGVVALSAEGLGGGSFRARVPEGMELFEGDLAVLPGLQSRVLGVLTDIVQLPNSSRTVLFRSPVNMRALRFVEVIKGS